ncbi:hypothetical protein [Anaerosacchariphilus polymeriproducens]|uniref:Uncharacterized protein n=1 Tax=Anaerosacchariphilus polymeriproducens TaxID=1812858 RepID=A0A371ASQ3_9FIRM|nr:hypothetical protein [Anaerosacchariphilus polymeriproducens]RDU22604.1 hypothetical protein DWV06_15115 [Anaerosacchariphilus polymeriproducens]
MKETLIKENDIYFMEVTENKIIVNDNYEGIIVFDTNMNLLKKMRLFEDIIIYSSYDLGNDEIVLFCPENEKILYINLEEYKSIVIKIDEEFTDVVNLKLFSRGADSCKFITPQEEYIEFSWKNGLIRKSYQSMIFSCDQKCIDRTIITDPMNRILVKNNDYINTDMYEHLFVIVYEEKIIYYSREQIKSLNPRKNYIFNHAKFVMKENEYLLVILSNNKEDGEESIISLVNI